MARQKPKSATWGSEQIEQRGVEDPLVLAAMRSVPREKFVPEAQGASAYEDTPLPIGSGQTISQSFIVAYMIAAVGLKGGEKCKTLEHMHAMMSGGMKLTGDAGPSSRAYHGIMMGVHQDMDITFTGNAGVDFVKGMIPHHQAAVDMATTIIAFGEDLELKNLPRTS